MAAHNESDFLCSQWLSGADSLSALCVSTGGFEALPWLDSRGHALTDVFTLAHTHSHMHTSLQLRFKVDFSSRRGGGQDVFEVLTHGRDTILSFGVLGLMSGEWVIHSELLHPANWEEDGA